MRNGIFDNVTLVIPAYDRPRCLLRVLDYYRSFAPGTGIIVADSGRDEDKQMHRRIVSLFSEMDIRYSGDYCSDLIMFTKLGDVLSEVDTKYCLFCGDDDFVTPRGIMESVHFLDEHADYTVAHGHYIAFRFDEQKKQFCRHGCYPYECNESPDAVNRFMVHFSNYSCATFYAVHRTDFLRMILSETAEYTTEHRFGELLPSLISLIHGKMKHLDVFYAARDNGAEVVRRRPASIRCFVEDGTYPDKYGPFRECLARHLSRAAGLSMRQSLETVDRGMHIYYHVNNINREELRKLSIYDKLFARGEKIMEKFAEELDVPSSMYYEDFSNIRNHVLRHAGYSAAAAGV